MNAKVSIIIPVYNGSNYLKEAIDSALAQTYENIEVLVINDGSKDDGATESIALSYGDKIRYLKKENGGVASALNMGIRNMEGDYFSWLSHDDVYYPDKVKKEMEAIEASGDGTALVQCEYDFYDMDTGAKTSTDFHKYYSIEQLTNSVFSVLQLQIHACAALIHKSHFERVGLFDESIRTVQDIEMWFRLFRNQKSLFLPESLYFVREHSEAGNKTIQSYHAETCKLYKQLVAQMPDEEIAAVFGSAFRGLVRMCGFLKSYNADITELETRLELIQKTKVDVKNEDFVSKQLEADHNKIYIFGAGQYGKRMLYELTKRNISVEGYLDNNKNYHGKEIDGIKCYLPTILTNEEESCTVIIAVRNYSKIAEQMEMYSNIVIKNKLDVEMLLYRKESVGL